MPHFTPPECDTGRRTSGVRTRQSRILLIDDYDDARAVVREALEEVGHVLTEASNGQQASNFLVSRAQEDIDLIIVDLQMPVMDGWRFIELLRVLRKVVDDPDHRRHRSARPAPGAHHPSSRGRLFVRAVRDHCPRGHGCPKPEPYGCARLRSRDAIAGGRSKRASSPEAQLLLTRSGDRYWLELLRRETWSVLDHACRCFR